MSQANIETHSRMRSSMILKDSVFRKEQRTHTISPEHLPVILPKINTPYKPHESPDTLPVSNPISAPSAISRIAVLIPHP